MIVRPGQTVCAELVATWPGPVVDEHADNAYGENDGGGSGETCGQDGEEDDRDGSGVHECDQPRHRKSAPAKQMQNRAVLFTGAIPYAAVRAAYECKVIVMNFLMFFFHFPTAFA